MSVPVKALGSDLGAPLLSVIQGLPTEEELAAVVLVLMSLPGGSSTAAPPVPPGWSAYWRSVRAPIPAGPHGWRLSTRPQ